MPEPFAVGVDLGGTKIELGLVDRDGRVHRRRRLVTDVDGGPAAVIAQIVVGVDGLRVGAPGVRAVGVGVAGQVSPEGGVVRFAPNLDWHDVPLEEPLRRALGLPVAVANDVRAATWGEWRHGAGRGCDDLVCVFVGTGVGGGIVLRGRLLEGATNAAGEVGHMAVDLGGPVCRCGSRGCVEAYAGGWSIGFRARQVLSASPARGAAILEAAGGSPEAITAEAVARAWRAGDAVAREIIDDAGRALAGAAVSLVNALNPARLILGGGVMAGIPELAGAVEGEVRARALAAATSGLTVLPAALGKSAGAVGAAAFALAAAAAGVS